MAAAGTLLGLCPHRRVHISSVTLEHLKGSYKVEPGDGQSRDSYLKEHGVVTFLVINPKVGPILGLNPNAVYHKREVKGKRKPSTH